MSNEDGDREGEGASIEDALALTFATDDGGDMLATLSSVDGEPLPKLTSALFSIGDRIAGRFVLQRSLGKGGMGQVFLARDTTLGRLVAVKTWLELKQSKQERARWTRLFRRDAASTAQLNHEHIVTIYEVGVDEVGEDAIEVPYMVLEYLEGEPLDELMKRSCVELPRVLDWAIQLSEALEFAHERGVIHRDLKPANVFVRARGGVKILDFGIALLKQPRTELEEAFGRAASALEDHLGEMFVVAGTPAYMAPEQRIGSEQDARADIYAFGAMLYELLAGALPFQNPTSVLAGARPDLMRLPSTAPLDLVELIDTCLMPSPSDRPASMSEVHSILVRCEQQARGGAPMPAPMLPLEGSFRGRQDEIAVLARALDEGKRVITVTGPVGVGKSRLAMEWGLCQPALNAVVHARLAGARSAEELLGAIAAGMGMVEFTADPWSQLAWALASLGRAALILDDADHVLDEVASRLPRWLAQAPQLRIVCTSREALRLREEEVLSLSPLSPPDALALWFDRTAGAWPETHEANAAHTEIISQLDHLPLAIELAAGLASGATPSVLLAQLEDRFRVLRSRSRDLLPRQRALYDTIQWSWELLPARTQHVMAQLTVFAGAPDMDAIRAVVRLPDEACASRALEDALEQLVERSFIIRRGDRFELLSTLRAFAVEQRIHMYPDEESARADAQALSSRHIEHHAEFVRALPEEPCRELFVSLAERERELLSARARCEELGAREHAPALATLQHALDRLYLARGPYRGGITSVTETLTLGEGILDTTLRAVLTRDLAELALAAGALNEADLAVKSLEALSLPEPPPWLDRAALMALSLEVGLKLEPEAQGARIEAALERCLDPRVPMTTRACLWGVAASYTHKVKQDYAGALERYDAAIDLSEQAGALSLLARWLGEKAQVLLMRGLYKDAGVLVEQARMANEHLGFESKARYWRGVRGHVHRARGDLTAASADYEHALAGAQRAGARREVLIWSSSLAGALSAMGHRERAEALATQAFEIAREEGDTRRQGALSGMIANMAFRAGALERARAYYQQAIDATSAHGDLSGEGLWRGNLGMVALVEGDVDNAAHLFERAAHTARSLGELAREGMWLGNAGWARARMGALERARELLERALKRAESLDDPYHVGCWTGYLGILARMEGDGARALSLLDDALGRAVLGEDEELELQWSAQLAITYAEGGQLERVRGVLERASLLAQALSLPPVSEPMWHLERARGALEVPG